MKMRSTLIFALFLNSNAILANPITAPTNRLEMWDTANAMPDSNYTIGTTSAMGTVKTLKANLLSQINLGALDMSRDPGAYLDSTVFNGSSHQALSDNSNGGYPKQCVAFARSMTGAKKSTYWKRGNAITDYLVVSGSDYLPNTTSLPRGTMIAYFHGLTMYPTSGDPGHVAIFLSWYYENGKVVGMNVVDQNLIPSVLINGLQVDAQRPAGTIQGQADGMIQKHILYINCKAGTACTNNARYTNPRYWSKNYNVVDVQ